MKQEEKEKRINSFALSFLERQQIIPNLYADQIIRAYKEGYHQAEKDIKVKDVDLEKEIGKYLDVNNIEYGFQVKLFDFAKHFFELGIKAQKGE